MLGNRFTAAIPSSDNPFEMLLGLFKEVIVHTSGDLEEAIEWLKQLDEHYQITSNDYTFDDFIQDLKDKGYIKDDTTGKGHLGLTSKAEGAIRKAAMDQLFGTLKKGKNGNHNTQRMGGKGDSSGDYRSYQFGDTLDKVAMTESLKNGLISGGIDEFRLTPRDLVVEQQQQTASLATVLMIDISHSMILYGEDRITPAKMVAMALAEWITTKYPKDTLDIIVYGNDSWPIKIKDLPYLQVGPYHTNFVAGLELAMGLLKRRKSSNKQIFNITDGKPSCLIEPDGNYYKNSFGLDPYITGKCLEMAAKTKKAHIPVNTFMIAKDAYLQHFIRSFSEINGGNAYYTGLNKLGELIFNDYLQQKNKRP
ncbi:MAG: hypothetical protein CMP53_00620 [Flavobacteriales bacterium]|nr:hypothetical protein [Flavobacteriales bacterium]|tara:strand:+ start:5224 stop:6318 length:1095 start_codon:yes stop_codon:yes gene_type:complete